MKLPMSFLLCLAHCQQNPKNTQYPTEVMVSSPEMLQKAVHYDYVGARFKGGYRSIQNFLMSNVSIMDCDNTHTKDPLQMVHPEQLALIHPEVAYAVVPSRHNWMAKGNFPAAPRYHTFYFHDPFFRAEQEGALKGNIHERLPFYDGNCKDPGRFFFGYDVRLEDIIWHPGSMTIDEYMVKYPATMFEAAERAAPAGPSLVWLPPENGWGIIAKAASPGSRLLLPSAKDRGKSAISKESPSTAPPEKGNLTQEKRTPVISTQEIQKSPLPLGGPIPEGRRNKTLYDEGMRLSIHYGVNEETYEKYLEVSRRCVPPLPDKEVASIWKSATKNALQIIQQDGYIPPEQYEKALKGCALIPDDFSDLGQAKVFYREYKEELVYAEGTDYMRYNGTFWEESIQLAVGLCEDFMDRQLEESKISLLVLKKKLAAKGVDKSVVQQGGRVLAKACQSCHQYLYQSFKQVEVYGDFVKKRRDMKYMEATLKAAKPMFRRDISTFDKNPFLLNTPKGTYDLTKGMAGLASHKATDYITKVTSVSPDDQQGDLWQACLETIFQGDQSLIYYVQQMVGLAAIGKVYQEALIISYGEGSNGKSTFWNAISRVLGTYSGSLSADVLTVGCRRNVKPEMAELRGKRLVIASELEEGMRLNTSLMKQLCSTDEVAAEKKYKDPFRFTPTHTLVLCTNHLPKVGSSDKGTWRRLILIPFMAKLPDQGHVKNYADYLVQQAGGAILKWIIEGAEIVIHNQFAIQEPAVVLEAKGQYRAENDWLGIFLDDCCDLAPSYRQESGTLYLTYHDYCSRRGEYARSTTDFYTALSLAGYQKKRTSKGSFLMGLQLKGNVVKSGGAAAFGGIA